VRAQEGLKYKFLRASILCKAVVCCRVTPAQKAQVSSCLCRTVCVCILECRPVPRLYSETFAR
jgi:magnesium-transporting ATPase (P-type)